MSEDRLISAKSLIIGFRHIAMEHATEAMNTENTVHRLLHEHKYTLWNMIADHLESGNLGRTVDAVPIVRCKECKYRGDELRCPMCFDEWDEDDPGFLRIDNTVDDGFCHKGAKMDGGAEG